MQYLEVKFINTYINYHTFIANDENVALSILKNETIDLIILNYMIVNFNLFLFIQNAKK